MALSKEFLFLRSMTFECLLFDHLSMFIWFVIGLSVGSSEPATVLRLLFLSDKLLDSFVVCILVKLISKVIVVYSNFTGHFCQHFIRNHRFLSVFLWTSIALDDVIRLLQNVFLWVYSTSATISGWCIVYFRMFLLYCKTLKNFRLIIP